MTGLYSKKKVGSVTYTKNNKTGKTSISHRTPVGAGKTKSRNLITGRTVVRQTRRGG